jgi:hypothetical protein
MQKSQFKWEFRASVSDIGAVVNETEKAYPVFIIESHLDY